MFAVLIALAACKKKPNTETTTTSYSPISIYLVNNNAVAVNLNLYHTMMDYRNGTNAFASVRLDSGAAYKYTINDPATINYIEWYSDDGTYTKCFARSDINGRDWITLLRNLNFVLMFNGDSSNHAVYNDTMYLDTRKYYFRNRTYYTDDYEDNGLSKFLLPGNATSSDWHAVDISDARKGTSVWNTLTDKQRSFSITLTKDQTCTTHYFDTLGNEATDFFYFIWQKDQLNATLEMFNTNDNSTFVFNKPVPKNGDTAIFARFPYYYFLLRD